jgi:hypothetical protein
VAVYTFGSPTDAFRFVGVLTTRLRAIAHSHTLRGYAITRRGANVYFAFTEMDELTCPSLGLCVAYPRYGTPTCRLAGGAYQCSRAEAVPVVAFARVVAKAEAN